MTTSHSLNNNSHIDYRPDIDGLRALAVIAVVIFHASPLRLRGGFVGVDIFFVISGYLITSIILKGLANNSFSFIDFYARRIRRIFPALSVVLAACLAFGWFALLADEYMQLGKHIAGGAGFISNFVLWREVGYFDSAAETKPLLHLWSLGIEEQFYFIWPLLLWFAWKKRLNSLSITMGVVLLSFIACTVVLKSNATAAFYAPWNRFWELCCGASLAHVTTFHQDWLTSIKEKANGYLNRVVYHNSVDGSNDTLNHALSVIGFLLLVTSFITIHKGRSFPGKWALMPVIGSVLIIIAGKQAYINRRILSNKVLVWVGLISYPLYLWHWPLLSFARIVEGETPSHLIRWGAVAIAVLLSWFTYKFVEKPFRFGTKAKNTKIIFLIVLVALVGAAGSGAMIFDGLQKRGKLVIQRKGLEDMIGVLSNNWYHGKGDWLFLGNAHNKTVSKSRLSIMPPESEITITREIFSNLAKTGADYGAKVVLIIGPNKSSIYPEYLPDELTPSPRKHVDFFLDKLRDIPNLTVYNSTSDLLSAKEASGLLYWMTDTHWNNKGAFVAFTGFSKLFKLPIPQVEFQQGQTHSGDLIGISGLKNFPLHKEDNWEVIWKTRPSVTETEIPNEPETPGGKPVIVFNQNALTDKMVWVVGDSFTGALKQYFNATFKEVHYLGHWNPKLKELPTSLINANKRPDMIIVVRVERSF